MPEATIADMMQAYAQNAVELANQYFQVTLDYSEDSIQQVERFLGVLYAGLPKGLLGRLFKRGPSQDDMIAMSMKWGAYVGEAIRQRWWERGQQRQRYTPVW